MASGKELSIGDVQQRLPNRVLLAGPFFGFTKTSKFKCLDCAHRWEQTPQGVSRTTGCPKCAEKLRNAGRSRTSESYRIELATKHPNLSLIEDYVRDGHPTLHSCYCGHTWRVRPGCLLKAKYGCPVCANRKAASTRVSVKTTFIQGLEFKTQGAESKVLQWLVARAVRPNEINVSLNGGVPVIPYAYRGAIRKHFPDFLVRGVVLEVKSLYTLGLKDTDRNGWLAQTQAKAKGAADLSIPYRVIVVLKDKVVPLPVAWEGWSKNKINKFLERK